MWEGHFCGREILEQKYQDNISQMTLANLPTAEDFSCIICSTVYLHLEMFNTSLYLNSYSNIYAIYFTLMLESNHLINMKVLLQ